MFETAVLDKNIFRYDLTHKQELDKFVRTNSVKLTQMGISNPKGRKKPAKHKKGPPAPRCLSGMRFPDFPGRIGRNFSLGLHRIVSRKTQMAQLSGDSVPVLQPTQEPKIEHFESMLLQPTRPAPPPPTLAPKDVKKLYAKKTRPIIDSPNPKIGGPNPKIGPKPKIDGPNPKIGPTKPNIGRPNPNTLAAAPPPPLATKDVKYAKITKPNIDRPMPKIGVPKIGPKPNISRPNPNTSAGPKSNIHGSKPNISNKSSPILTTPPPSPIPNNSSPPPPTAPTPTAPPPPPPIPTAISNCSLESSRIMPLESIQKFDTSLLKKAKDLPKQAPKEGDLTEILMKKINQIHLATMDSFDSDNDSDDETYWAH